jgi:hypothetical protein
MRRTKQNPHELIELHYIHRQAHLERDEPAKRAEKAADAE